MAVRAFSLVTVRFILSESSRVIILCYSYRIVRILLYRQLHAESAGYVDFTHDLDYNNSRNMRKTIEM